MFYIRVDGNEVIAIGHVMRCLSIAEELKRQGEETTFIIADERPAEMIKKRGFLLISLNSKWDDLDSEIDKMTKLIKERQISLLLVDSYYVTKMYFEALKKYTKVAYIDDLATFLYPVDVLINYNIYAKDLGYEAEYKKAGLNIKFLLGCDYVPLRQEFANIHRTMNKKASKVFVTSGGADSYGVIEAFLYSLNQHQLLQKYDYYIVLGKFYQNKHLLMHKWKMYENIHFLIDIPNMSDYMKICDVAITAGGTTTYELCACGIPSIMYTLADNQLEIATTINRMEVMLYIGDVREDVIKCTEKIVAQMDWLLKNEEERNCYSSRMRKLVDGNGCVRLVKELKK